MNRWFQIPNQTKVNAYSQIADKTGMLAFAVEKDWWVVQTLAIVFEMEIGEHLVFKGGTSLSKAWGLIHRFSEDIDLAVDRSFFGYEGDLSKRERTNLRKDTSAYISDTIFPELKQRFEQKGLLGVKFNMVEAESSDQDPRIIEIYYPNVIESPGYLMPKVKLEIGGRSLREPFENRTFSSLIDEHYKGQLYTQDAITIPTVRPERTFLEKVFLLHEEFQRPEEKIRVDRLSRHLYDIYMLCKTDYADMAIHDKDLYTTIVEHRHRYTRVGSVDYNLHQPQTINPIPIPEFEKAWQKDYKTMQEEMIYIESPSYEDMIGAINEFVAKINDLDWVLDVKFPIPTHS